MRRYLILIAIIIYSGMCSYAQENINMIEVLNIKQDIVSLENKITDLIKKKPEIANIQGLRQFHIFWLGSFPNVDVKKENYSDYSFLYQLVYDYYHLSSNCLFGKKRKYIKATTFITDFAGNLVAKGDARLVTPFYKGSYGELPDMKLAKMFFNNEIDFVFRLGFPHTMRYMVGIKGNNLFAFENTKEGLKIYSWDEFMKCCFDEWVHQPPRK